MRGPDELPREGLEEAEFGVVYLAFGPPYLAMALVSALSLRVTNPRVAICVVTNVTDRAPGVAWWDPSLGDRWRYLDLRTSDNRVIKTDLPRYSPFPKTLYLDCDTFVVGSLDRIPVFLNYFDLVLRFVNWPCRVNPGQVVLSEQLRLREVSHFNGGVIGFRKNPATEAFFRTWAERFVRMGLERDQPSLVEACFLSPVHLFPLREEWNQGEFWFRGPSYRRNIVIWHYKSRSWDRRIAHLVRAAVPWFRGDAAARHEVERYVRDRRAYQNRGLVLWRLKALGREVLGPLSKIPERRVGKTRWRELVAGKPVPKAVP